MRRLTTCTIRICVHVLILVAAVAVTSQLGHSAWAANLVTVASGYSPAGSDQGGLRVTGAVPELSPGLRTTLEVSITNSGPAATIRTVEARVVDASAACGAQNVEVVGYARSAGTATYVVAPGETVAVPLQITMLETGTNQDACKGATFPLELDVTTAPV